MDLSVHISKRADGRAEAHVHVLHMQHMCDSYRVSTHACAKHLASALLEQNCKNGRPCSAVGCRHGLMLT